MAVPEYRDEVSITLSIADPSPNFAFSNRKIFLSKKNSSIEIGRTSKRNVAFEAAKCNAWFDSPVMSRKHARFTLDADKQKVYVRDTGSLHGTYKNDVRLETNVDSEVISGDMLKFGAFIERPQDKHYPCAMVVHPLWGPTDPARRGNTFRVPEDSDIEDLVSDDDQVNNSYEMLRSNKLRPAKTFTSSGPGPIDLTVDDQYPLSNVRDDEPTSTFFANQTHHVLDIPSPQELPGLVSIATSQDVATSPNDNTCEFSDIEDEEEEEEEEEETGISQSSMDTDDSDSISEAESTNSAPSPIVDAYAEKISGHDEYDEDFAEHDEFEEEQVPEEGCLHHEEEMRSLEDQKEAARRLRELAPLLNEDAMMTSGIVETSTTRGDRSQAPVFSHQSDGVKTTQLDKIDYPWKRNLPPMVPTDMPSPVKLPPFRTISFSSFPLNKSLPMTTAEAMGEKHGNYEYYYAREENKARVQGQARSSDSVQHMAPEPQCSPAQIDITESTAATRVDEVQKSSNNDLHAASVLVSSGNKFLATPSQHVDPEATSAVPELDETSAWAFEQSKKASDAAEPTTKATDQAVATQEKDIEVVDAVEAVENPVQEPVTKKVVPAEIRSSKRKADEISQLTPGEEALGVKDRVVRLRLSRRGKIQPTGRLHHTSAEVTPPPNKRLRRMAEAVGYVALGGAAVMSVLIATAPAL